MKNNFSNRKNKISEKVCIIVFFILNILMEYYINNVLNIDLKINYDWKS